jgi:hypothetical protein
LALLLSPCLLIASPAWGESVRTIVYWADGGGAHGQAEFEGIVRDGTVTGRVLFGGESLIVLGTVDETGAVAGVLETQSGNDVGTFETNLVDGELSGEFTVTGVDPALWTTDTGGATRCLPDVSE